MSFTRRLVRCVSLLLSHYFDDSAGTAILAFAVLIDREQEQQESIPQLSYLPFCIKPTLCVRKIRPIDTDQ
ncbi:BgTH12-03700 [Blumeria graminis f. sp. triticale]|uniref:BgTH12-03700 n=1 Tax=Blumeria graminis f. sp. triticale TaxID=1689686 RepID=A0A9W4DD14_BLUGR|nr:BgTH12-03700 [Blumeria graminis f. sp. triticale]